MDDHWQAVLRRALDEHDPDDWAFRPGRHSASSGQVADFVRRTATDLDIRPARMRSTWLCQRLEQDIAVDALLAQSGLQTYAALDRYRSFLPVS
ncbi:hypothetical protein ACQXVK_16630 [Curtobacterium sp. AB451]|uniref:hypothetical protein n=1 Tax=Curtobacterium sp. AB451 TaxID=3422306 RepID=UPI003D33C365